MAKATAVCTCKICNKNFEVEHKCYNRDDADRWEMWAQKHYDTCPDCRREKARKEASQSNAASRTMGLADLYGSPYTIPKATEVRNKFIQESKETILLNMKAIKRAKACGRDTAKNELTIQRLIGTRDYVLKRQRSASWWIGNQEAIWSTLNWVYREHREEIDSQLKDSVGRFMNTVTSENTQASNKED